MTDFWLIPFQALHSMLSAASGLGNKPFLINFLPKPCKNNENSIFVYPAKPASQPARQTDRQRMHTPEPSAL